MRPFDRRVATTALAGTLLLCVAGCEPDIHLLYGFIDESGKWLVEPAFDDLSPPSEGLAAARQGSAWGYVDARGDWVVEPRYAEATPFREGLAAVRLGQAWQFIDRQGEAVIAGPFDAAGPFEGGIAAVKTGAGWGFVDHAGAFAVAPRFDRLGPEPEAGPETGRAPCFSEGLCAARVATGWGYIDRAGRWVVAPTFAEAGWFREGLAAVRPTAPDGSAPVGFIDRSGEWVIEPRFEASLWFSGGRAIAMTREAPGRDGEADAPRDGSERPPPAEEAVNAKASQARAVMIDAAGREVADVGWEPLGDVIESVSGVLRWGMPDYLGEGLIPATRAGAWGFMNRNGDWVIEPAFGLVMPFRSGLAAAAVAGSGDEANPISDGGWGLIDTGGRWVVEPGLRNIGRYGDPYVMAQRFSRWGLLDRDGHWRVSPRFADQKEFLDLSIPGLEAGFTEGRQRAAVFANHRWTVVARRGRPRPLGEFEWVDQPRFADQTRQLVILEHGRWGIADDRFRTLLQPALDERPAESGGMIEAVHEGRVGCVDHRGRWAVPAEFTAIRGCASGPVLAATEAGWGVWQSGRGWLLEPAFEFIDELWPGAYATEAADGWHVFQVGAGRSPARRLPGGPYEDIDTSSGNFGIVMREGRFGVVTAARPEPSGLSFDEFKGRFMAASRGDGQWITAVRTDEHWGLLDASGGQRLPTRFDAIGEAVDGLVAVEIDGLWGVVDLDGEELFATRFEQVVPVSRRVAFFRQGKAWGLVDRDDKVLEAPRFGGARRLGRWSLVWNAGDPQAGQDWRLLRKGLVDQRGRVVVEPRYTTIEEFGDRLWLARDEGGWVLLDKRSGRRVAGLPGVEKVEALADGRAAFQSAVEAGASAFGYLDDRGEVAIAPSFDEAGPFEHGIAVVGRSGKCGVIDRRGRELLPIDFDHCNRLPEGRVAAGVEAPFDRQRWARSVGEVDEGPVH